LLLLLLHRYLHLYVRYASACREIK
jgi:hypothetical protein